MGGDTGTTRSNDHMLLMNRAMNPSFERQNHSINLSPFLETANRRSIINPTPLRHNPSFMSNNSIVPNFGGGGDRDP